MAVVASNPRYGHYSAAGAGPYSYNYQILSADEIEVYVGGVLVTNYTLTGVGDEDGGTFTFLSAPATDTTIFHRGLTARTQQTDYDSFTSLPFSSAGHEAALDKLTLLIQEILGEYFSRTPLLPVHALASQRNRELPLGPTMRLLGYDASNQWTTYPITAAPSFVQFDHLGNYGNSLATAVASIGASGRMLYVLVPANATTTAVTVPSNIQLIVPPSGSLPLSGGSIAIQGGFQAGRYQVFSGTGTVTFPQRSAVVFPEWWGADPTGATAANETPFAAALAALPNGGTLLGIGPWGTYRFGATIGQVRTSNVTIDMQNALLQSALVFNLGDFNGDSGVDGDYADELENCTFKNARIGAANDATNGLSPFEFTYVRHGLIENVHVRGEQNGFNIQACNHVIVRNCSMLGQRNEQIGFFFILSNDCVMDSCYYDGDDAPLHGLGVQIKGGRNNRITNCTFRRLAYNGAATHRFCVYVRGFDPYSNVAPASFSYPYPDIGYGAPDDRRQSINTVIEGCCVEDSPTMGAFRVVESVGTRIVNCAAHNVRTGVTILRGASPAASNERDVIVENCVFTDIGVDGAVGAAATAIFVESSNADPIPGVQIRNNIIRNCSGVGISVEYTQDLLLEGNCVYDTCIDLDPLMDRRAGIDVILSDIRPRVLNNTVTDTRTGASRTMDVGIFVGASTVQPIVSGNIVHNCIAYQLQSWVVGDYANNYPGEGAGTTTIAGDVDSLLRFAMMDGQTAWIAVEAVGRQSATHHAYYAISGLFHMTGGVITQIGTDKAPVWRAGLSVTLSALTQLTNNSGGTANDTIDAITGTAVNDVGATVVADHVPTRNAIADLAEKTRSLLTAHAAHLTQQGLQVAAEAPVESNTAWTGIRFSILDDQVRVMVTPGVAVEIAWVLKARCVSVL